MEINYFAISLWRVSLSLLFWLPSFCRCLFAFIGFLLKGGSLDFATILARTTCLLLKGGPLRYQPRALSEMSYVSNWFQEQRAWLCCYLPGKRSQQDVCKNNFVISSPKIKTQTKENCKKNRKITNWNNVKKGGEKVYEVL